MRNCAAEGGETASDPSVEAQAQRANAQVRRRRPLPVCRSRPVRRAVPRRYPVCWRRRRTWGPASGEIAEQALGQALQLGTEGEETLTDAAELRAALGQADRIEANELPAGYAPLIENYLRDLLRGVSAHHRERDFARDLFSAHALAGGGGAVCRAVGGGVLVVSTHRQTLSARRVLLWACVGSVVLVLFLLADPHRITARHSTKPARLRFCSTFPKAWHCRTRPTNRRDGPPERW